MGFSQGGNLHNRPAGEVGSILGVYIQVRGFILFSIASDDDLEDRLHWYSYLLTNVT